MTSEVVEISSSPDMTVSSGEEKTITVERLKTGLLRIKVNDTVVATDPSGTVLRPLMAALRS